MTNRIKYVHYPMNDDYPGVRPDSVFRPCRCRPNTLYATDGDTLSGVYSDYVYTRNIEKVTCRTCIRLMKADAAKRDGYSIIAKIERVKDHIRKLEAQKEKLLAELSEVHHGT